VRNSIGAVKVENNDNKEKIQQNDTEKREGTSIKNNNNKERLKSNHSERIQSNTIFLLQRCNYIQQRCNFEDVLINTTEIHL